MTFRIYYYADQAFLSFVKRMILQFDTYTIEQQRSYEAEDVSACIISCHSAIEAFLNINAREIVQDFNIYESLTIESKISELYRITLQSPNWSELPLQDIKRIVRVRNWLTHYKNPDVGLVNSMGQWVIDSYNKKPKVDDGIELKIKTVKRYYNSTRNALLDICRLLGIEHEHTYLIDEKYNSYVVG